MAARITAKIYRSTRRNLSLLAGALKRGELVAVPTETVYGLAANALDPTACRRIFAAKGRPTTDPLIVHLRSADELASVAEPNSAALKLARHFWPGPLTLILPKRSVIPEIVTAGLSSVAVRVPRHPDFQRLLQKVGLPLAAPSANRFGYVSPTTAQHVKSGLAHRIRYVLDGGASAIGIESTILDLRDPQHPQILRPGAITLSQISAVLGYNVEIRKGAHVRAQSSLLSPGLLKRHYSPRTRVRLHAQMSVAQAANAADEAWVFLRRPAGRTANNTFWLSSHGSLNEVAHQLFATLRMLDEKRFAAINIETPPAGELANAINDRLQRAAAR